MPGDIAGMVSDTEFMNLAPAQQRQALAALTGDSDFNSLNDAQTAEFITRTAITRVPRPTAPNMQETDYFGNPLDKELIGLAAQGREGYISDPGVSGAMSLAGAGVAAAPAVTAAGQVVAAHPVASAIAYGAARKAGVPLPSLGHGIADILRSIFE